MNIVRYKCFSLHRKYDLIRKYVLSFNQCLHSMQLNIKKYVQIKCLSHVKELSCHKGIIKVIQEKLLQGNKNHI